MRLKKKNNLFKFIRNFLFKFNEIVNIIYLLFFVRYLEKFIDRHGMNS